LILGSLVLGAVAMGFLLFSARPGRETGPAPESNARPTSGDPAHSDSPEGGGVAGWG